MNTAYAERQAAGIAVLIGLARQQADAKAADAPTIPFTIPMAMAS